MRFSPTSAGGIHADKDGHIYLHSRRISLPLSLHVTLLVLLQDMDTVLSRETIAARTWRPMSGLESSRAIDVCIARLRQRLGDQAWRLVHSRNCGYAITSTPFPTTPNQ